MQRSSCSPSLILQMESLRPRLQMYCMMTDASSMFYLPPTHLISPTKRRSFQQWASSSSLIGFAKVGYPGVIYAQGEHSSVEEFVDNVKTMQWLALKVRFVEPLHTEHLSRQPPSEARKWKEFQKVGEVVEEMRKLGREEYVVEMGIGSARIAQIRYT